MKTEDIARVCHEATRAYCVSLGDFSHAAWDDAPEWQRLSCIEGVRQSFPGKTAEQYHESWLAKKREDGWIIGRRKDPTKKTHPCLVPYDDLPTDQKLLDEIFAAIVSALTG